MTTYWMTHQVGGPYYTLEESKDALFDRYLRYPSLYELMPVIRPGKVVLDHGCGPGHDTILFLQNGAKQVFFTDVSEMALRITLDRLELHGLKNAIGLVAGGPLPVVDHVHCAGVIHHTEDPSRELRNLRVALKDGGEARFMVYDGALSTHSQSDVPITHWWTPDEFLALCREAGFEGKHVGSYPCSAEWRPDCWAACFRLT